MWPEGLRIAVFAGVALRLVFNKDIRRIIQSFKHIKVTVRLAERLLFYKLCCWRRPMVPGCENRSGGMR